MKLRYFELNDAIYIDKPAGISTQAAYVEKIGAAELYQREINCPLFVVHHLDKTTSGALLFAKTAEKAKELVEHFKNRMVKKKYWFLTNHKSDFSDKVHQSVIEKDGKNFVSKSDGLSGPFNSETRFTRIKRSPFFELWEAEPISERPHQVRLHAADLGLPILGDTLYGDTAFPRLCLHSLQIQIPGEPLWNCPPPRFFERLGLLKDLEVVGLLAAIDVRQRFYNFLSQPKLALRLSHLESDHLRLDLLGPVLWGQWYKELDPGPRDLLRMEVLGSILHRPFLLRKMNNRGKDPTTKLTWMSYPPPPEHWLAEENGLQFEFYRERGLSSGLFLDQRENRKWLLENSKGLRVLNLFAYTCGFSVAAAAGGASEVVSVDVSQDFLNWGKRNFEVNALAPQQFEFFKQDSILFLNACIKRGRKFDRIICDPPTFGRHKEGVFKFEKDWEALLNRISYCLAPDGQLLFCHNFEEWTKQEFYDKMCTLGPWELLPEIGRGLDYEPPNTEPIMKHVLMKIKHRQHDKRGE